ncbi:hypothetical protein NX059_010244 [Plenodomus lindquistii]|nr:hypothetical protein NX059_010244 [Plenodomus lindquistii]
MSGTSIVVKRFSEDFNRVVDLFERDQLDEYLALDSACPRYHRIRTLIVLGHIIANWDEADQCRIDAEALWGVTRPWHPEGEDETTDKQMAEIREELDGLFEVLAKCEPEPPVWDQEEVQDAAANVVEQMDVGDMEDSEDGEHRNMNEDEEDDGSDE